MATRHSDGSVALPRRRVEDWEDWECDDDDDVLTLIDMNEPLPLYGNKLAEREANTKIRSKGSASPLAAFAPHHPPSTGTNVTGANMTETNMPLSQAKQPSQNQNQGQNQNQNQTHLAVPSSASGHSARRSIRHPRLSTRASRHATGRVSRPASRRRQKPAPSKLSVITDMSILRRTNQHQPPKKLSPEARPPKFVDLAALAALEGEPTPASFGNWGWLRKTILQSPKQIPPPKEKSMPPPQDILSPEDRPIMIGITLPPGEQAAHDNHQHHQHHQHHHHHHHHHHHLQATISNTTHIPGGSRTLDTTSDANQPKSVWSPDTPDTVCSFASIRPASSVYSQMTVHGTAARVSNSGAPPVPALPANYQQGSQQSSQQKPFNQRLGPGRMGADDAEDDVGTPCTLFEEDDNANVAPRASVRGKPWEPTPSTANSAGHGWWDHHLVTPFLDRTLSVASRIRKRVSIADDQGTRNVNAQGSPAASVKRTPRTPPLDSESQEAQDSPWPTTTTHGLGIAAENGLLITFASDEIATATASASKRVAENAQADSGRSTPTLRIPTPRRTASPAVHLQMGSPAEDKSRPLASDRGNVVDIPPPYSPLKRQLAGGVSYQVVLPPDQTKKPPVDRSTRDVALMISMASRPVPPARRSEEDKHNHNQPDGAIPCRPEKSAKLTQAPSQSRFSLSPDSDTDSGTLDSEMEGRVTSVRDKLKPQPFPVLLVASSSDVRDDRFDRDLEGASRDTPAHEPTAPKGAAVWSGRSEISAPLPVRPTGRYLPEEHNRSAEGQANKVERQRRRHEKEDVTARRVGGFWRGRGCIPSKGCLGCFGRSGREGRKKRRIWAGVIAAIIAIIILAIVLGLTLAKHHAPGGPAPSIWVNLTDYPPMPTGVLTFVGPDNTAARSGCTEPSTLWSCSLPKDDQSSVSPYKPNQPTVVFQIDWDNSTRKAWNTPNGKAPESIQARDDSIDGFQPNPSPPTYEEMWFLGETTDNITSSQKAGEPAPFFISILNAINETVSPPVLHRRDGSARALKDSNATVPGLSPPDLEADGTPKGAVMIPKPVQQPVRLYDRGLPTEHYGFYTYFKRTIYLKSVTVLNRTEDNVGLDEDGGCRKTEADYLVTWAQTRMLVQIWTRQLAQNGSSLLQKPQPQGSGGTQAPQLIRPGSMPYPVTVTLDTHGGDPNEKFVWDWPLDDRQKLDLAKPDLLANNIAVGGSWVNHRGRGDAKYGGFDGGSGGCQCQWVNFV